MTPEIHQRIEQIQHGEVPRGYQKRASGIVPRDWVEYSLGEIYTERKMPGDPSLPILTVSIHSGVSDGALDEDELGKNVKRIEDKTQYKTARTGDLVFNMMRAWQGAIGVARSDGLVSPAYIVATPEPEVYPPFMDYYFKMPQMINKIHRQSYGVTDFRLRLYWDSFIPIRCSLPSIPEQKKIVEILSTQDKLIDLYDQKIEHLYSLKKACLGKMFPSRGHNAPEARFAGFTDPWESRKFDEIAERASVTSSSLTLPRVEYEDIISEAGQLNKNVLAKKSVKAGIVFRTGDVLYGKLRPYLHKWLFPTFLGLAVGDFWVLHPQNVDSAFLYCLVQSRRFDEIANQSTGTKMPRADWSLVSKKVFFVPRTIDEQTQIGRYFCDLDNLITLHQRRRDEEIKKRKALMQLLLTGIVRVKL